MSVSEAKARLRLPAIMGPRPEGGYYAMVALGDLQSVMDDHDRLAEERAALRAELVEVLRESVAAACEGQPAMHDGKEYTLDSLANSIYASQLRRLATLGKVEIIAEHGRRVIARWKE